VSKDYKEELQFRVIGIIDGVYMYKIKHKTKKYLVR